MSADVIAPAPIMPPPDQTSAAARLFPFQQQGVACLLDAPAPMLADEMGPGKTVQAIVAISILQAPQANL